MPRTENTHSILMGYLLWIFGFMGAHRFYYGKQISGVIWFCTLGLLFVGWIIDLFLIPSMEREAEQRDAKPSASVSHRSTISRAAGERLPCVAARGARADLMMSFCLSL